MINNAYQAPKPPGYAGAGQTGGYGAKQEGDQGVLYGNIQFSPQTLRQMS